MESAPRCAALAVFVLVGVLQGCASAQGHPAGAPAPQVTSADLRDGNEPIEVVLQRKVPGVVVTRTGDGGIALQIRGSSSYNGNDPPPLFVLNGLPFHPGAHGALTGVNPADIESIRVLKGAEAGLYGMDGANGVIVITTKYGGKPRS